MKTTENTILITGGTAGIGFEMAKAFLAKGNKVIITGRDKERLDAALSKLPTASGILGDVTKEEDLEELLSVLKWDFPTLNMVINNAGRAVLHSLIDTEKTYDIALEEMQTNYLAIVRLNQHLLPLISAKQQAAIVNVSSIVAFVPGLLPTYSASKAALHAYTQLLRIALEKAKSNIRVFELMPPLVNTDFSAEIGGENGIPPAEVAHALMEGMESDNYEIRVGQTQNIYELFLKSPAEALRVMNGIKE